MRGRHSIASMRALMRRAAARRRLAIALRRKPFGRLNRPADSPLLAREETGLSPQRPFAWRKGEAQ
jgi:hypothetical protein